MTKFRALAVAIAAFLVVGLTAQSASATTGGKIRNRSSYLIDISAYNPYAYPAVMQPGTDSEQYMSNVQCFKPRGKVKSQYGGIYYANVIRCMSGNNIILWFTNA